MISNIKKKVPKKSIVTVGVVLLMLLSSVAYVYAFNGNLFGWKASRSSPQDSNPINYGPTTPEQKKDGENTKQNTSGSDQLPAPSKQADNPKSKIDVTITAASQNGNVFQIRALISAVENTGTCTLTMTRPNATTVTLISDIQSLPESSTCKGFDVPIAELSAGGWQATITYDSATLTGSSKKNVTIE